MLVSSMDRLCLSLKTGGRLAREDLRIGGGGGSWEPSWGLCGMAVQLCKSCAWSRCLDTNMIDKKTRQRFVFVVCSAHIESLKTPGVRI